MSMTDLQTRRTDPAAVAVRPLSPALGVEVLEMDASRPVADAVLETLRAALDEHGVLLFRRQRLDPENHIAFSRRFGTLQEVAQKQYQLDGQPLPAPHTRGPCAGGHQMHPVPRMLATMLGTTM